MDGIHEGHRARMKKKLLENGEYLTRNAYEVSAFTLDAPDAAPDFSTPSAAILQAKL